MTTFVAVTSKTAILLFSRTADAESRAKAFGRGTRVAQTLLERTERTLAGSGLPVVRSTEAEQRGSTFGERIAFAVSEVFDRGYARVIVVGSDCASIRTSHLRAAAQLLERGGSVLGPDHRGGAWLIGLQQSTFDAEAFAQLRWETAALYDDLGAWLPGFARLQKLHDLNVLADFQRLWCILRGRFARLFHLVFSSTPAIATVPFTAFSALVNRPALRGPPVA